MTRLLCVIALVGVMVAAVVGIARGGGNGGADARGAQVLRLTIDSKAAGAKLPLRVVIPPGEEEEARPLVLFLHGRGQTPDGLLNDAFFRAYAKLGPRAPVIAVPYGEDHSYWHNRDDGAWRRYVLKEVLPRAVSASGADGERLGIAGISMGGFGALDIAQARPRKFCAAAAHSPALWRTSGETAPGAFDDASDFNQHNVVASASRLSDMRVWLDAGTADPFLPGDRAFVANLRTAGGAPTVRYLPGGHDSSYWDKHWGDYFAFYERALRDCG